MSKGRYIDQWFTGLGLEHLIPKLTELGYTTPKKLATLNLKEMYEKVGIEDVEDKKKLYYLIHRLKTIFKTEENQEDRDDGTNDEETATENGDNKLPSHVQPSLSTSENAPMQKLAISPLRVRTASGGEGFPSNPLISSVTSLSTNESDDDLKSLRKQRKVINDVSSLKSSQTLRAAASGEFGDSIQISTTTENSHVSKSRNNTSQFVYPNTSSSDILGKAESVVLDSANFSNNQFRPSLLSQVSGRDSDVAIGSVTAKVLARRQQKSLSNEGSLRESVSNMNNVFDRPISAGNKIVENKIKDMNYYNEPPESPPPPAPPMSRSGSLNGSLEGRFSFSEDKDQYPINSIKNGRTNTQLSLHKKNQEFVRNDYEESLAPRVRGSVEDISMLINNNADYSSQSNNRISTDQLHTNIQFKSDISNDNYEGNEKDMAIRVVVRKRPIGKTDLLKGSLDILEVNKAGHVLIHEPKTKVDLTKVIETHAFQFDDAFDADVTNEQIYYRTVRHLISILFDFGKATCFAYGQTGSGKTFTMMGSNPSSPASVRSNAGLYVLAARDIFSNLQESRYRHLQVYVSCFEIYAGKLFDLLNDRNTIKCLEDSKQQVQTPGLTEHRINSVDELLNMMSQAHALRSIGSTGANLESSRSHQVLQIIIRKPEIAPEVVRSKRMGGVVTVKPPPVAAFGKLSFIDLAGSERGADTTHNSKQTRMEGAEINTSLLALKEVIRSLNHNKGHTPFRGSKLTQVLKDSFIGEKTRTCMVACVSPAQENCEHTLNTLRYADRVKEHQLSNPNNLAEGNYVGDNTPTQFELDGYEWVPPASVMDKLKRPSTAQPPSESHRMRSISVGPFRPSTSSGMESHSNHSIKSSEVSQAAMLPARESDRVSEDRRYRELQTNDSRRPALAQQAVESPSPEYSEHNRNKLGRESRIPSSPSSRLRQRGQINREPALSLSPANSPLKKKEEVQDRRSLMHDFSSNQNPSAKLQSSTSMQQNKYEDKNPRPATTSNNTSVPNQSSSDRSTDEMRNETLLLHKTVELLSAHKLAIAEMVEVMKDEMGLVQDMESSSDRDSENYAEVLSSILNVKTDSIRTLQKQLSLFRAFRKQAENMK